MSNANATLTDAGVTLTYVVRDVCEVVLRGAFETGPSVDAIVEFMSEAYDGAIDLGFLDAADIAARIRSEGAVLSVRSIYTGV